MNTPLRCAFIGIDTIHSVQFARYIQDPAIPEAERCTDLTVTRCLAFETAFQGAEGVATRTKALTDLGVLVTRDFDEAVADCDVIFLELNDPAMHLDYFRRCAPLGKPIFLDKPFADTLANARAIDALAKEYHIPYFTASKLRNYAAVEECMAQGVSPSFAIAWGSIGTCPESTSKIVWYGVHAFEILERAMGVGAESVLTLENAQGYDFQILYADGRTALVKMVQHSDCYGCLVCDAKEHRQASCNASSGTAVRLLRNVAAMARTGEPPFPIAESFEVMALLEAADKSLHSGKREQVERV